MNIRNKGRSTFISAVTLTALFSGSVAPARSQMSTVTVNPTLIRKRLISDNNNIIASLNSLYTAKVNVTRARTNLMPSLNLGAALSANPISFGLSSITALLPFLLPSNWYALDMSKHQLAASGYAYYIVELNTYASGLGLYETILEDMALRKVYYQQYLNYLKIQNFVQLQTSIGHTILADLQQVTSQTEQAATTVQNYDALIQQEMAQMALALGYKSVTPMSFEEYHPTTVSYEGQSAQRVMNAVFARSPEEQQARSLILAAKAGIGIAEFSWLTGSTVSAATSSGRATFNAAPSGGLTLTIGPQILPTVELANLTAAQARDNEIANEENELAVITSAVNSIEPYINAVNDSTDSVTNLQNAFTAYYTLFAIGQTDLEKLLDINNQLGLAQLTKVGAQYALDNERIDLMRATISGQFKLIPTCRLMGDETSDNGGVFGWFKDIFSPQSDFRSVDQICRTGAAAARVARTPSRDPSSAPWNPSMHWGR